MKTINTTYLFAITLMLFSIIGCKDDNGKISCGSNSNFTQQEFHLTLAGIEDLKFQNFSSFSCFQQNYWADTYRRSNYNINGFEYYTRSSKLELPLITGGEIIIEFEKAFLNGQEDENVKNWHAREILNGDFVYGIDGNYVNNPPYTSATALLWANYPTVVNISYTDANGKEWSSTDVEQFQSAAFTINNFEESEYSPENAPTTQYDFNVIATGKVTCTLKARNHNGDNIQLIEAPFKLPFHLIK